jgi:hypothetical protein
MFWPIFIYTILSIVLSISAGVNSGWSPAWHTAAGSLFALAAGGGWRASLRGARAQKIAGSLIALALLALALWLGRGFVVTAFGHHISGLVWAAAGFAICFVFADEKVTGE